MASVESIEQVKQELGNRLRRVREEQGLTQERLGLMVGLDRTYILGVEKGRRNISLVNLIKLSRGLDITLSELFSSIDPENPDIAQDGEPIDDIGI